MYAAYNSFAEVGGVPKSPRSKVRMRRVFIFYLKSVSHQQCMRVE